MGEQVYIGVDVGTGSVRAAAVRGGGELLAHRTLPITVHNPAPDHYEQDSGQIWQAVCQAVQSVCSKLSPSDKVSGVGFDATCSLVLLDNKRQPVSVDQHSGEDRWNIVMWMDHRAAKEAQLINSKQHSVLQYVGGKVSLEMQTPKLLWLKRHLPETWSRTAHFMDLPDFLTSKATGKLTRSLCSLVCKWTYVHDGQDQHWDSAFLKDIGLEDLTQDSFAKIGREVLPPGSLCGAITAQAASELGVPEGTPVGASLIDAHAGALALLAAGASLAAAGEEKKLTGQLALISGTSSCQLICSPGRLDVPGVWGPYYSALLPGCWLAEAGQSATGALCDHVIATHPALDRTLTKDKLPVWVESLVYKAASSRGLTDPTTLTRGLHVYPDHHGNRAPLADPLMTGMVSGLTLSANEEDLAMQYLATIQALAYGTRAILDQLRSCGHTVSAVLLCGGLAQSRLFTQTHADVLGVEVAVPSQQQLSVVLGAAMLGAAAAAGGDVDEVLRRVSTTTTRTPPNKQHARYHEQKYQVYKKMQADQLQYRDLMSKV